MAARDRDPDGDGGVASSSSPTPAPRHPAEKVLPDRSVDDGDVGWGERQEESRDDEWYLRERPPHHGG